MEVDPAPSAVRDKKRFEVKNQDKKQGRRCVMIFSIWLNSGTQSALWSWGK